MGAVSPAFVLLSWAVEAEERSGPSLWGAPWCPPRPGCISREEAASLGMTPSNFIEAKAPEDSKRAGEKPEACPSFSLLPMASGAFKKTGEDLSSWGRPLQSLGA